MILLSCRSRYPELRELSAQLLFGITSVSSKLSQRGTTVVDRVHLLEQDDVLLVNVFQILFVQCTLFAGTG